MLRTIIIDDEPHMRQTLEKLVKEYCPNVNLVGKADGVKSGMEAIKRYHPDLVLLDIRMNDGTGFDLLKQLESVDFKVIFITAFDQYAIKAFKFSALDYLLKPVDHVDLIQAVNKVEKIQINEQNQQLNALANNLQSTDKRKKKIILRTAENIYVVKLSDVIFCESDNNYTKFNLLDGSTILVSKTLKDYDEMLSEYGFFRVHQSFLINLVHMVRFEKSEGGSTILSNENKVPVASRKREQLLEILNRISENY